MQPETQPHPLVAMLAAYRRSIGIVQERVAAELKLPIMTIKDLENGVTRNPSINLIESYAAVLGCRITWGIGGIEAARLW